MHRFLALRVPHPRLAVLVAGASVALVAALVYTLSSAGTATAQQGAARGATVYMNNCQVCHGVAAQGRMGPPLNRIPPEVAQLPRPAVVQDLTGLIRNGIPGAMPRFVPEQLSDADIAALVDYLLENAANRPPGRDYYDALQPLAPVPDTADRRYFPQTRHTVSFAFKRFYEANGGVRIFGLPVTEEYTLVTENGEVITAQDFERARFEFRNGSVQLGLIGAEWRSLRTHFLEGPGDDEPPSQDPAPPPGPPGPSGP